MKALVCFVLSAAAVLAQTLVAQSSDYALVEQLAGNWVNSDPYTSSITRLEISAAIRPVELRAWARCQPIDCPLGSGLIHLLNGQPHAVIQQPFISTQIELRLVSETRLEALVSRVQKERGAGPASRLTLSFEREKNLAALGSDPKTRAMVRSAAQRYQKLGHAFFEYSISNTTQSESASSRVESTHKVWVSGNGRVRRETRFANPALDYDYIVDGASAFTYYPAKKEYRRTPNPLNPLLRTPFEIFAALGSVDSPVADEGEESIAGHDCRRIRVEFSKGNEQRFWIEPGTYLIWQSQARTGAAPNVEESLIRFRTAALEQQHQASIFEFDSSSYRFRSGPVAAVAPNKWVGQAAPELSVLTLDGRPVKLSQWKGKTVLLEFWATWCGPCRAGMPGLEAMHRELAAKGLEVIAISNESPEQQQSFLAANSYTFQAWQDLDKSAETVFEVDALPTQILISAEGKILYYRRGIGDEAALKELLRQQGLF
jgi:thiol-disulfide isomerase/thioredoxin